MKLQLARAQALLNQSKPKPDEAMKVLQPLVNRKNAPWPVYHFSGIAFLQKKEYGTALSFLNESIKQGADEAETYHSISICYFNMGNYELAEENEQIALDRRPDYFKGWLHLGSIYRAQAKLDEALKCYQKANALDQKSAGVAYRIAEIYNDQGDMNKALELYKITVKVDPEYYVAYLAMAQVLRKQKKYDEAEECIYTVLKDEPKHLAARVELGEHYKYAGNYEKAIELYEQMIREFPKVGGIRVNYALCLQELGRFEESEKHYMTAFKDQPESFESLSNYLMGVHYNPERTKEEIFEAHKLWDQHYAPTEKPERPVPFNRSKDKKIRLGLISGGFRTHPVGWMITKALENLPSDQFEVYCYTTNNSYDKITRRIHEATDKWQSVIGYNDQVIAGMIREDEIDILVELSGHSADTRLKTVALEPAPVIVKWVGGLFNTTGLKSVDYLLTDHYETPDGEEKYYTEKLIRMPDDYISFLPPDYAPEVGGLPLENNGYVTFGCFNNPTKVNDEILVKWAQIMNRVPESRLFLKSKQYDTAALRERIISTMKENGIGEERLRFEGLSPHNELLDKYNDVDIALDPWPYSGGLTTCEALWMGVPVVTKPGPTFAGRHSTTHLINAGLPEFVTDTWEEYIEKTVQLTSDVEKLSELRAGLRSQVEESPLADGPRFGANFAKALRSAWHQWVDGFENNNEHWADHIDVDAVEYQHIERTVQPTNPSDDMQGMLDHIDQEKNGSASDDSMQAVDKTLVNGNLNGVHENGSVRVNGSENSSVANEKKPDEYKIETTDGVTICTPADLEMMTPYVLLEQKQWYENELDFVREYLKTGMSVVDVGAGFGVYALPAAKLVGESGKVFAFEPGTIAKQHLEMSKLENSFQNLEVIGKSVSSKNGKHAWKIADRPELNRLDVSGENEVSAVTLDAWWQFEGEPTIDLVKIDINGNEGAALKGAIQLLDKEKPVLVIAITEQESASFAESLAGLGFSIFEYIPGPGILAEYEAEAGTDPYMQNLIVIPNSRTEEFKKAGWLHDGSVQINEVEKDLWKTELSKLPWTSELMEQWGNHGDSEGIVSYLQALNYLIAAEQIDVIDFGIDQPRSQKAGLLLNAAQILIGLYNQGANSTSIAFTLVRTLNALGKRSQAVEVMQKLIETTKLGQENMNVDLPFMLPVPEQGNASIKTDLSKWLRVKTVEAWILLKDLTTYLSGAQEKKLVGVLEGNVEVIEVFQRIALVTKTSKNVELKIIEREKFSELIGKKKDNNGQSTIIYSEPELREKQDISQRIFNRNFWSEQFTSAKAKKIVEITKKFIQPEFSAEVLDQIIEETKNRLKESGDDNIAFFIQVHALLALNGKNKKNPVLNKELAKALKDKSWEHKAELYDFWFDNVESRSEVENPEVSAIIISNRFKEKSVENLKRLSQQLEGRGEIIFVNNGIEDSEFDSIIEYVDTYVKANGNSGAYLARNLGALFAKGKYLLFVDDDGIPDEGFVDGHLEVHLKKDIVAARGACYSGNGNDPSHYNLGDKIKPAPTYLEGNTSYKASAFLDVDGWGDYIMFGHGGMELCYRLINIGFDKSRHIYSPQPKLQHDYNKVGDGLREKHNKQTTSYWLISCKQKQLPDLMNNWRAYPNSGLSVIDNEKPKVWLLDPGLHSPKGHHFTYAQEFVRLANESNQQICILTHQLFEEKHLSDNAVLAVFDRSPYSFEQAVMEGVYRSNKSTERVLKNTLSERIKPGDKVVMHTAGINHIQGILNWFEDLEIRSSIEVSICFQEEMNNRFATPQPEVKRYAENVLKQAARFYPNIKICTTIEPVADTYSKYLGYKPNVVGCIVKSDLLQIEKPNSHPESKKLLYISSGRDVQGVKLVLELAMKLHNQPEDYELTVYTGLMEKSYRQAFKRLDSEQIHIIEQGDLSYSYEDLIIESDAVLLPYEPNHFKEKLSGILLDVLATKTPVITTNGTYLNTFISEFNEKPGVTMTAYNIESLQHAIQKFIKEHKIYMQAATKAGEYVRKHFNADNVIKKTISAS